MTKLLLILVVLGFLMGTAGCALRSTQLVARRGEVPPSASARHIALMPQPQPTFEENRLRHNVATALGQSGFQVVEPRDADLLVACQIEQNWKSRSRIIYPPARHPGIPPMVGPAHTVVIAEERSWSDPTPVVTQDFIGVKGIRLQFYDAHAPAARRFETVWEGYIEAGLDLAPERQPALLQILLDYFGRDYSGRVKQKP